MKSILILLLASVSALRVRDYDDDWEVKDTDVDYSLASRIRVDAGNDTPELQEDASHGIYSMQNDLVKMQSEMPEFEIIKAEQGIFA